MTKLTLICPTIGRTSLKQVLEIVVPQLQEGDEFIVVSDGSYPKTRALVAKYPQVKHFEIDGPHGDYACAALDFTIPKAKGDFIFFIGDDDVPTRGAFETIRGYVAGTSEPHLFAVMHTGIMLLGELDNGKVTGQQLVFPNDPSRIPKMACQKPEEWCFSDWIFIQNVVKAWDYKIQLHNDLIATIPQQNRGTIDA